MNEDALRAIEDGWRNSWESVATKPKPLTLTERGLLLVGRIASSIHYWAVNRVLRVRK